MIVFIVENEKTPTRIFIAFPDTGCIRVMVLFSADGSRRRWLCRHRACGLHGRVTCLGSVSLRRKFFPYVDDSAL